MANIAQTVNVLQAVILTDGPRMLLTPTYHVFEMYKVHQGATLIPIELASPPYAFGQASIPALHATASRDANGRVHLSLVNLDANRAAEISIRVAGATGRNTSGRLLTAPAVNSINTFDRPDTVRPTPFTAVRWQADAMTLTLPSKSVLVLAIQ